MHMQATGEASGPIVISLLDCPLGERQAALRQADMRQACILLLREAPPAPRHALPHLQWLSFERHVPGIELAKWLTAAPHLVVVNADCEVVQAECEVSAAFPCVGGTAITRAACCLQWRV
jgi:hypothetical protein